MARIALPGTVQPQEAWPWLFAPVTQAYNPPREYGIDLGMNVGTPITSLTDGTVLGVGYPSCPGGVVSVECLVFGRVVSFYYQHLDQVVVHQGQQVHVGQLLGYSGGQLSGGHHPSQPACSSGPHIEIGINAPWGGVWSPRGANMDPTPFINSLKGSAGLVLPTVLGTAGNVGRQLAQGNAPGFAGILEGLGQAEQFTPPAPFSPSGNPIQDGEALAGIAGGFIVGNVEAFTLRAIVVLLGLLLVGSAVFAAWQQMVAQGAATLAASSQAVGSSAQLLAVAGV